MDTIITSSKTFAIVNAVAENITPTLFKYAANEVSEARATALLADEMTEQFQGILTQLDAIEIIEVVEWNENKSKDMTYVLMFHELKECVYGFDSLKSDNVEKTRYFHFETAREAFQMLRDFLTI